MKQKLAADKPFVWLKRQISPAEAEKIQALNADGIGMFYEPNRHYPQGQLGRTFDRFCRSRFRRARRYGAQVTTTISAARPDLRWPNAMRWDAVFWSKGVEGLQVPPGSDIHLTLDTPIQHMAEKELAASISKISRQGGCRDRGRSRHR